MQKITPFLWFNGKAEAATHFYLSIFRDSKMIGVTRSGREGSGPEGGILYTNFQLLGQEFMALNGGPEFQFSPAISFFLRCDTQEEVDYYWERLSAGGEVEPCGWLKDPFGVSWQIVPAGLEDLLYSSNPEKSRQVFLAMLRMKKLNLAALQQAYDQG
jgi:predicted 3-demethylubiquinone-9 3-methyltransferase (glyoxalase superfamily)